MEYIALRNQLEREYAQRKEEINAAYAARLQAVRLAAEQAEGGVVVAAADTDVAALDDELKRLRGST